jgi:hypothetical protein
LVQLTYAHDVSGTSYGPPAESKFGIVPTHAPSDANRWAAGLLEQVLAGNPSVGNLLEHFYVADESAYLAFTRRDEEYAVVDYCKVLEEISSQVAREHKEEILTQATIGRELEAIVAALRTRLDKASSIEAKASAVRDAQLAIAAANFESQKRQILKAGELLLVPSDIKPALDRVWKLRSSTASHAGGGEWPSDALVEARMVSMIYLSHFVASRHVRDQGMTLAEAVEKHKANTSSS